MREGKDGEDAAEDAGREVDGACDQQLEFLSLHRCNVLWRAGVARALRAPSAHEAPHAIACGWRDTLTLK